MKKQFKRFRWYDWLIHISIVLIGILIWGVIVLWDGKITPVENTPNLTWWIIVSFAAMYLGLSIFNLYYDGIYPEKPEFIQKRRAHALSLMVDALIILIFIITLFYIC